jgi:putative membrane protein
LTSLALAVGIGRVAPEVSHTKNWPYELIGAGFAVLGVVFLVIGYARTRAVEEALDRGEFARFGPRLALTLLVVGLALGAATLLIVLLAR